MTRRRASGFAVLWLLLLFAAPGHAVEEGDPVPDFAFRSVDGASLSRADLLGKPALLVFWNTWCPECMKELPKIERLSQELGPRGLVVVAVNTGINDSEEKARAYWKRQGYGFPTGFDAGFERITAFQVRGVPTVFLIDAGGVVRYKQARVPDDLEARLRQLGLE